MSCRGIAAAMVAGLLSMPAVAADKGGEASSPLGFLPVGQALKSTDWTGLYVGAHGGYLWGDWSANVAHPCPKCVPDPFAGSGDLNTNGWLGGIQVGADKQFGRAVIGVALDVSKGDLDGAHTFRMDYDTDWAVRTSIDWLGSARLRLGYSAGPMLLYVTGGLTWARVETGMDTISITGPTTMSDLSSRTWHFGHVLGGGAEWAIASSWTLSVEYLHYDLGSANYDPKGLAYAGTPGEFAHHELMSGDLKFDVARVGVNYRFGQ